MRISHHTRLWPQFEKNHQHKPRPVSLQEWEEPSSPGFPCDLHANLYVCPTRAVWIMGANEYLQWENIAALRLAGGVASWFTEEKYASHTWVDGDARAQKWTAFPAQILSKWSTSKKARTSGLLLIGQELVSRPSKHVRVWTPVPAADLHMCDNAINATAVWGSTVASCDVLPSCCSHLDNEESLLARWCAAAPRADALQGRHHSQRKPGAASPIMRFLITEAAWLLELMGVSVIAEAWGSHHRLWE